MTKKPPVSTSGFHIFSVVYSSCILKIPTNIQVKAGIPVVRTLCTDTITTCEIHIFPSDYIEIGVNPTFGKHTAGDILHRLIIAEIIVRCAFDVGKVVVASCRVNEAVIDRDFTRNIENADTTLACDIRGEVKT